jgi:cyclopropane fatty-acyl-phospholipid synthase-like methyltransferase
MFKLRVPLCCLLLLQAVWVFAEAPLYQQYPPSAEGTGKVFMGREIAHVMGYQGAAWLEREAREKEERTDVLVASLNLQKGMKVADVGAGTGYLSRRMAEKVGASGLVYALDVQPEMVGKIKALAKKYPNIQPVLSQEQDVQLPENSVDLAMMVDVYHELAYPHEMIQSVLRALKPNAQLVLVEYRAEDDRVPIKQTHKMSEQQIIKELTVHPLKWQKTVRNLPWQHIVIFTKS